MTVVDTPAVVMGGVPITRRGLLGAAAAVPLLPVLAACGGSGGERAGTGTVDQVTWLTTLGQTPREAYAWVAQAKGFFAEVDLEVQIQPGAAGEANYTALAGGAVDFAGVDCSGAFIRYVNGVDTGFQVVAAVQQLWPMALLGYADEGLIRPRDLNGATIGLLAGTIAERLWPTYAALTPGVDPDTVTVVPTSGDTQVGELVAGRLDAIALFAVSAPGLARAGGGREVSVLPWADALGDLYGNAVITRSELAADNPDLVRRFTGALLRGLAYTLEYPEEAGQILHEAVPEQDPQVAAEEIILLRDYCYGGLGSDQPLGLMEPERVAKAMALLSAVGEITEDFNQVLPAPGGDPAHGVVNFALVPGTGQEAGR